MLCVLAHLGCQAQKAIRISDLNGTKWTSVDEQKVGNDVIEFRLANYTRTLHLPLMNETLKVEKMYYISPTIPTCFEKSKVGSRSASGCYLVEYNEKHNKMNYFTIKEFDLKKGIMVLLRSSKQGLGPRSDGTITYRLIGSSNGSITPVSSNWGNNIGSQTQQNSTSQTGTTTNSTGSRGRR